MADDAHRLMNEVLPAPTSHFGAASPRRRTLQKMERLLTFAATGAAIGGCSNNGGRTTDPTVDIPPTDGGGPGVVVGTNTAAPPIKSTATPDPTTEPSIGYAVVDPMPPPAVCAGVAATVKASATWKQDKGGLVVELVLPKPGYTGAEYVIGSSPNVYGGKVINFKAAPDKVVLTMEVSPGTSSLGAQISVKCPPGPGHLDVNINLAAAPKAGVVLPTSLFDRW
jgi:hypothetical protein